MDEIVKAGLHDFALRLSKTMSAKLRGLGIPAELHVVVYSDRVVIGSKSKRLRDAELGSVDAAPVGALTLAARSAMSEHHEAVAAAGAGPRQ